MDGMGRDIRHRKAFFDSKEQLRNVFNNTNGDPSKTLCIYTGESDALWAVGFIQCPKHQLYESV